MWGNLIEGRDVLTVSDNIKIMKHHIKTLDWIEY